MLGWGSKSKEQPTSQASTPSNLTTTNTASAPTKKSQIRLFNTHTDPSPSNKSASSESSTLPPYYQGSSKWGLFYAATSKLPFSQQLLLLRCLTATPDGMAVKLRDKVVPQWRYWSWAVPCLAAQYQAWIESPLVGTPGLIDYIEARSQWIDQHITEAASKGVTQLVILGSGFDTRTYRLASLNLRVFEIDSEDTISAKQSAVTAVHAMLPPPALHHIPLDWTNLSALIPALTAAGFNPSQRCVIIMEGLLAHLPQAAVNALFSDLAALAAPGSRLCFDFLHQDALDGTKTYAGYAALATASANKAFPYLSAMNPSFSTLMKHFQQYNLMVLELRRGEEGAAKLHCQMSSGACTGGQGMKIIQSPGDATAPKLGLVPATFTKNASRAGLFSTESSRSQAPRVLDFFSFAALVKLTPRLLLRRASTTSNTNTMMYNRIMSGFDTIDLTDGGELNGGRRLNWCSMGLSRLSSLLSPCSPASRSPAHNPNNPSNTPSRGPYSHATSPEMSPITPPHGGDGPLEAQWMLPAGQNVGDISNGSPPAAAGDRINASNARSSEGSNFYSRDGNDDGGVLYHAISIGRP